MMVISRLISGLPRHRCMSSVGDLKSKQLWAAGNKEKCISFSHLQLPDQTRPPASPCAMSIIPTSCHLNLATHVAHTQVNPNRQRRFPKSQITIIMRRRRRRRRSTARPPAVYQRASTPFCQGPSQKNEVQTPRRRLSETAQ